MAPQDMAAELASTCDASPSARRARVSDLAARMLSKTSKQSSDPAILLLADGTAFYGRSCGDAGTAVGEVCFNTSLEGYFEVVTPATPDRFHHDLPQIGNYGIDLPIPRRRRVCRAGTWGT